MSNIIKNTLLGALKPNQQPHIYDVQSLEEKALIELFINEDIAWFDGHFPEQPVLPGVVQVDWAGKWSKALFSPKGLFYSLSNIKFKTPILPQQKLSLELLYNQTKGHIKFHYFHEERSFSSGIFKFKSL